MNDPDELSCKYCLYPEVEPLDLNLEQKAGQSFISFVKQYGLTIPDKYSDDWRMVLPLIAGVKGQPHYGDVLIRATDGVHAFCEVTWMTTRPVIKIHITNFQGEIRPTTYKDPLGGPMTYRDEEGNLCIREKAKRGRPKKPDSELKQPRRKTRQQKAIELLHELLEVD